MDLVTVAVEPATSPGVDELLELSSQYALALYPPEHSFLLGVDELLKPSIRVYVARDENGRALGMAALNDEVHGGRSGDAELKRMIVRDDARGQGVASRILKAIEADAAARGRRRVVLETGPYNDAAIRLYEREGYEPIPLFGQYLGEPYSLCYAKAI